MNERISRRDFLKFMGAAAIGSIGVHCEKKQDGPKIEVTPAVEGLPPVEPQSETIETQPENNPLDPRMSSDLAERLHNMREHLYGPSFDARRLVMRAEAMTLGDSSLIEVVYNIFRQDIKQRKRFETWTPEQIDWFTDLCVFGQVTTESSWNRLAEGADSDIGLWQITNIAAQQINIELGLDRNTPFDRTNPILSTENITLFYDYLYRDLRINGNIENIQSEYEVQPTEFLIPLLLTIYTTGRGPIISSLRTFTTDQRGSLDVFAAFMDHLGTQRKDNGDPLVQPHKLEYFFKSYLLCKIFQEERQK